jgi:hypothetical protein
MAARDNICAYLDNELSPEERRRFEEHIESCDACRQELEEMRELVGLCTSLPQQELPEGFKSELHERLLTVADGQKNNVTVIDRTKKLRYIKMLTSVAAGLLLIFLTGSLIKYGFFQMGLTGKSDKNTAMAAMEAPAQPSASKKFGAAADNGAAVGAATTNAVTANAADAAGAVEAAPGIVSFNQSVTAPNGTEADRSVTENDRGTASVYTALAPVDDTVSNKVSTITITVDDPGAVTEKIKILAVENNGGLKEPVLLKSAKIASDGQTEAAGTGEASATATTGTEAAQPLRYVIPSANYDKFMSSINGTFGASNIQSGALVTEDLTGTLKDKMKQSDEIDAKIQELQQDSAKNAEAIDELKAEQEQLDDQIETIRLDTDFVTITIYINKK